MKVELLCLCVVDLYSLLLKMLFYSFNFIPLFLTFTLLLFSGNIYYLFNNNRLSLKKIASPV